MMKLREIRQDKGLSRSQLAKEASLNYITIWQIENGKTTTPYLGTVGMICDALEVSPNEVSEFSFGFDHFSRAMTGPARGTLWKVYPV